MILNFCRRWLTAAPAIALLFPLLNLAQPASAQAAAGRSAFARSVVAVPATSAEAAKAPRHAWVSRVSLTAAETARSMTVEVALKMRNFDELQARVASGEQISRVEMAEKYFPNQDDHDRLVAWLQAQGLSIARTDANRLAVFVRAPVSALARAFQVTFSHVSAEDGEYVSATSAPSLPTDLSAAVVGIHGLQPHLHPRRLAKSRATATNNPPYLPAQIAAVYNASGLTVTGAGQTIAIFSAAFTSQTDLTAFWKAASVAASYSNIQNINVAGGPATSPSSDAATEAALDIEWTSALAPGAVIRVYGANENDPALFDEIFQQVYADLPSQPTMHQFSVSYGGDELEVDHDYLIIEAQYMANLAGAGVTVLVASGDTGSSDLGLVQTTYPTSDPDVTGVGGTTLLLNSAGGVSSEVAWSDSGGGISAVFARPAWQTGTGVPAGTTRCVPDVASAGDPNTGAVVIQNGKQETIGGTSWGAPTWAAFCALINQARASAGQAPLGLLNPRIYPLIGSTAFRDITSGNNGSYTAGVGYDLCTGIGVPNVTNLIQASLVSPTSAPTVAGQLGNRITVAGQPATFFVAAEAPTTLSYQWQRAPSGSATFASLSDNSTYNGSATATLVVNGTTLAMTGDQFQCIVSTPAGTAVSAPAASLTVVPVGVSTFAGWPESGGSVDGTGWKARFDSPGSVRTDTSGNVYVADSYNNTIRKITPAGVVTTYAGAAGVSGTTDGPVASARFNGIGGVATDAAGNVYVADSLNYTIRKISAAGVVSTLAGQAGVSGHVDGTGTGAEFSDPENLALDPSGNIYVADGVGNTIRVVSPTGVVSTLAGASLAGSTDGSGTAARFDDPTGIAVDPAANVFVADNGNSTIRKITPAGAVTTLAGSPQRPGSTDGTGTAARFYNPAGLAVNASDTVFVADYNNSTIRQVTAAGVVTTIGGSAGQQENIDGLPASSRFSTPADVAIDPSGNLFIADTGNQTIRRIVPGTVSPPVIQSQPSSVTINSGQNATFTVTASGLAPLSYQWQRMPSGGTTYSTLNDNGTYSGSATATLTLLAATVALDGSQFQCVVTNPGGSTASSAASLFVQGAPSISTTAQTQSVAVGGSVTLSVAATGRGLSYQWQLNGVAITGATASTLTLSNVQAANAGTYTVVVTNSYGSTTATIATLSVLSARLTNLSARAAVGTGSNVLIAGFAIGGTGSKQMILRGVGPTLASFGVTGVLATPQLTLVNAAGVTLFNGTAWGGSSALAALFNSVGAFALPTASADSATVQTLPTGNYTATVSGVGTSTGVALAELYDADSGTPPARLTNISARALVGTGANILVAGFNVSGGTETVLIRGIGPGLTQFGLTGVLANPVLTVYNSSGAVIASNQGWAGSATLSNAFTQVGAFSLPTNSADSALLLTLPAGTYSAQVSGINSNTGIALAEVYEVPH